MPGEFGNIVGWLTDRRRSRSPEGELSQVVLIFIALLIGVLLFVHLLFAKGNPSTGSSRSPAHQGETK